MANFELSLVRDTDVRHSQRRPASGRIPNGLPRRRRLLGASLSSGIAVIAACSDDPWTASVIQPSQPGQGGSSGRSDDRGVAFDRGDLECGRKTCAELGWACGYTLDACGNVVDCADEGLACGASELCAGGVDGPTLCLPGAAPCEVCAAIPDCSAAGQPTRLQGRVVSPGRTDDDSGNQVGVPNAVVFILRNDSVSELPEIPSGIPSGGASCQRCDEQDYGPVLAGAVTDSLGSYVLEGRIPVDREFVLVVEVARFRRAVTLRLPASAACQTTRFASTLPDNPTRLPRGQGDGLAVNLPRVAVTTGQIDAMECVFEKLGFAHEEFGNPAASAAHFHLFQGGPETGNPPGAGARIDAQTPHDSTLYGDLARLESYDLVVSDCEGPTWDSDFTQRDALGANLREYVNRGGRLFASHLSFSWLAENGAQVYSAADPIATGLGPAASWSMAIDTSDTGTGRLSLGRPQASPHIESFAAWMLNEGITTAESPTFSIIQPRSQNLSLGGASEEFVYLEDGNQRVQQFSFNTPYAAPSNAACGRVSYSGFHVSAGQGTAPFIDAVFPEHCSGDLTDQEKVLAYMLFDVSACIGDEPVPPACTPLSCGEGSCGLGLDGCGNVLDCGPCRAPE